MSCFVPGHLVAALRDIAADRQLLLCCDFDGTLSEIVARPEDARLMAGIKPLLELLSHSRDTRICLISGRSLRDLITRTQLSESVIMIGSHGAESALHCDPVLCSQQADLLTRLKETLHQSLVSVEGVQLEYKPYSISVHVRRASRQTARSVIAALRLGPARWPGVISMNGKEVIELGVYHTDKGKAIDRLRNALGADYRVVYIGDDVTDEHAFSALSPSDVGIKVGAGSTHANYKVDSPSAVKQVLEILVESRCKQC